MSKLDFTKVVLVDEADNELGVMDKLEAHTGHGTKHRAITAMAYRVVNGEVEVLLQKRSKQKPLWPLFWDATCSTHPALGEGYAESTRRRFAEEMGIVVQTSEIKWLYKFSYQADYDEELAENELNGILVVEFGGEFEINHDEVAEARWVSWEWLEKDVVKNKSVYAVWFQMMMEDRSFTSFFEGLK